MPIQDTIARSCWTLLNQQHTGRTLLTDTDVIIQNALEEKLWLHYNSTRTLQSKLLSECGKSNWRCLLAGIHQPSVRLTCPLAVLEFFPLAVPKFSPLTILSLSTLLSVPDLPPPPSPKFPIPSSTFPISPLRFPFLSSSGFSCSFPTFCFPSCTFSRNITYRAFTQAAFLSSPFPPSRYSKGLQSANCHHPNRDQYAEKEKGRRQSDSEHETCYRRSIWGWEYSAGNGLSSRERARWTERRSSWRGKICD